MERKKRIKLKNPMIHIRDFADGTYSVTARVWNPQKKFYEHPTLINLSLKDAKKACGEIIKQNPTIEEIINTWIYIGD